MDDTTSGGWDGWLQSIGTYGLKAAIDSEFVQPFQLERDKTLAQDPYGRLYLRGQPGSSTVGTLPGTGLVAGVPKGVLIGGAIAAVFLVALLLKD